jgi:hypothetical protein
MTLTAVWILLLPPSLVFSASEDRTLSADISLTARGSLPSFIFGDAPPAEEEGKEPSKSEGGEDAPRWSWDRKRETGVHIDTNRFLVSTGLIVLTISGYATYGFLEWWVTSPRPFHFADEGALQRDSYVGGVDKFGHAWGCHVLTRGCSGLMRWSGVPPFWSSLIGIVIVQGLFLFAEIEDGYYDYGWNDADVVFNLLGSALATALDLLPWLDDLIDFRLWYQPTPVMRRRHYNVAEDYSGQKYFLVIKGGGIPTLRETGLEFLELYVGYHAPGYRRHRERKERFVFVGFSLDIGKILAEYVFPLLRPPRVLEVCSDFVFEHWHPHFVHAPLVDAKIP